MKQVHQCPSGALSIKK
ncbi:hypothetical protein ACTS9M_03170 [Empedobacter sp. ULE_I136]